MPYLGVLDAVHARLAGHPFQYVPPLSDSPGAFQLQDASAFLGQKDAANVSSTPAKSPYVDVGGVQTAIYYHEDRYDYTRGYPAFTYEVIEVKPRFDNYLFKDDYSIPEESPIQTVYGPGGRSLGASARMGKTRPIEQPMDFFFAINSRTDDLVKSAMAMAYIWERFPPRHFIRVPQEDGSYRSWDMFHVDYERFASSHPIDVVRVYHDRWVYRVEGYLDTTGLAQYAAYVRSLELRTAPK